MRRSVARTVLVLGFTSAAWGAQPPVTVSPGHSSRLALIGDGCPTFSWGAVPGAKSYELVVFRLADEGEESQPVLSESFAGSATSWTPSLDRCLERGGRYAWSVRAVGGRESSEWSALSLFQVAARPSQAELERALALVRQYFVTESGAELEGSAEVEPQASQEASASSLGPPAATVVGTTQLSVDGGVVATSFSGDGSTMTNLDPANLSSAVPLSKGGTGATNAAGARANLNVVEGAHTVDTDTNAQTECAAGELLDGDGVCVTKIGLNDLTSCDDGDVPVYELGTGWVCAPPVVVVMELIEASGDASVSCPPGMSVLTGGIGPASAPLPCTFLEGDLLPLIVSHSTNSAGCNSLFAPTNCACIAVCR